MELPISSKVKIIEKKHTNGNISLKGKLTNGNEEGYWIEYHRDGKVKSEGLYVNGEKSGVWMEYYNDGKLSKRCSYVDVSSVTDMSGMFFNSKFNHPIDKWVNQKF